MRFTEHVVQRQRFFCRRFCPRIIVLRRSCSVDGNQSAAVRNSCVSERVTRVLLHRLLEVAESFLEVLTRPPVPKIATLQVKLMRLHILCRLGEDRAFFRTSELRLQLLRDRFGDVALNGKNIRHLPIEGICPEMGVGLTFY